MESKIEDMRGPQETKLQEIVQQKESIMRELEKMYQTQRDLEGTTFMQSHQSNASRTNMMPQAKSQGYIRQGQTPALSSMQVTQTSMQKVINREYRQVSPGNMLHIQNLSSSEIALGANQSLL